MTLSFFYECVIVFALTSISANTVLAQIPSSDTIRIISYNVDEYEEETVRNDALIGVLGSIQPDILVIQELIFSFPGGSDGVYHFHTDVLDSLGSTFARGTILLQGTQRDTHVFTYYDSSKLELLGIPRVVRTEPYTTYIALFKVKPTNDTVVLVNVNLYEQNDVPFFRSVAVRRVLDSLDSWYPNGQVVFGGSFNMRDTLEAAYYRLTQSPDNQTRFFDPAEREGFWSDNEAFADVHTSSTRLGDSENDRGLRDRFDQIFLSTTLRDNYLEGSYTVFGNDGGHFSDSINAGTNNVVTKEMADHLHTASDRLPVYLDLVFGASTVSSVTTERNSMLHNQDLKPDLR